MRQPGDALGDGTLADRGVPEDAAVLVSLYPGVTVLLAGTLLHERFTLAQRAGLGLCALAIAAIALN